MDEDRPSSGLANVSGTCSITATNQILTQLGRQAVLKYKLNIIDKERC